jgi:hypothetical protein
MRQVKHSFLAQFLHEEETEAKAASKVAKRVRGVWARGLESVFGITAPDPKLGKEGSRVIHPQSAFATGEVSDGSVSESFKQQCSVSLKQLSSVRRWETHPVL